MRRTFAAIARFRPRALTLVVLLLVATLIGLANLSFDLANGPDGGGFHEQGLPWGYDATPNHEARWLPTRNMTSQSVREQLHVWTW